jgi:hypothetical protein
MTPLERAARAVTEVVSALPALPGVYQREVEGSDWELRDMTLAEFMDSTHLGTDWFEEFMAGASKAVALAVLQAVREPSEGMADKGEYVNSEWLNDAAPLGQRRYREPAKAVFTAMIDTLIEEAGR